MDMMTLRKCSSYILHRKKLKLSSNVQSLFQASFHNSAALTQKVKQKNPPRPQSLYDSLRVLPTATQTEIKNAYYELAIKYHPDTSKEVNKEENFREIINAYQVLGNVSSRKKYDEEFGSYFNFQGSFKKEAIRPTWRLFDSRIVNIDAKNIKQGETFICHLASLSSILGKPFRVTNICHHAAIRGIPANEMRIMILLRQLCNGSLSGSRGSKTMTFLPSDIQAGKFYADAYQFGNVCGIIPFSILCMMFAPSPNLGKYNTLFLNGPTYTFNGLHIDHIAKVYLPVMKNFGMSFEIEVKKRGYLPYGRGRIVTKSKPICNFQSIDLTMPGMVVKITGRAFVAGGKPIKIAQKMAKQALKSLKKRFNDIPIMIDSARELDSRSEGMGQGILLVAETSTSCVFSGSGLWKTGVDTDDIVEMAISELLSNTHSGGCVDSWMQDKVITAMALAHGESVVLFGSLTPQAKAAIKALRILTKVRIQIIKQSHSPEVNIVKCNGLGFTNLYLNKR